MVRKQRTRGRQVHPKGPFDTVDDELKIELRKAMDAKGWDQKDLAREIPCSPASITNLFKPGSRQTRFKRRLFEVLGIPGTDTDDLFREATRGWPRLSRKKAALVVSMIRELGEDDE